MDYTNNHKYVKKYKGKNGKWIYSYVADIYSKKSAKTNISHTRKEQTKNKSLPYKDTKLIIDKKGNKTYERTIDGNGLFDTATKFHNIPYDGERSIMYITNEKGKISRSKGKKFIDKIFGR